MTPFVQDADFTLYVGDVRDCLRDLPAGSVHTVVTSPPYWGLRDYGTGAWEGGDPDCDHSRHVDYGEKSDTNRGSIRGGPMGQTCDKCGATRIDQQLGLEPTPELFVAAMVDVFREVRRVLRDDGTLWLNLGDSYNANVGAGFNANARIGHQNTVLPSGLPAKNLMGMPWRVAFALQQDGWILRSDIIWSKPNPMPESVTDRPTKAHEYLFLLSKQPKYFFDQEAVRERLSAASIATVLSGGTVRSGNLERKPNPAAVLGAGDTKHGIPWEDNGTGRNVRSVWEIATQPYPEAHFATFPEALPERCIKAGTSERGCCPECGAPWERVTDVSYEKSPVHGAGSVVGRHETTGANNYDGAGMPRLNKVTETKGWRPTCKCHPPMLRSMPSSVPCTVLDPFMGSGTTALVARRLGRRSVGVELNPEYAALCARRLQQLSLLAEV